MELLLPLLLILLFCTPKGKLLRAIQINFITIISTAQIMLLVVLNAAFNKQILRLPGYEYFINLNFHGTLSFLYLP
jgi:hypothetical protein